MRKHATGKAKIELHVLNVERGLSWEGAQEKWEMLTGSEEGFYLSQQVSSTHTISSLKALKPIILFNSFCITTLESRIYNDQV